MLRYPYFTDTLELNSMSSSESSKPLHLPRLAPHLFEDTTARKRRASKQIAEKLLRDIERLHEQVSAERTKNHQLQMNQLDLEFEIKRGVNENQALREVITELEIDISDQAKIIATQKLALMKLKDGKMEYERLKEDEGDDEDEK